MGKLANQEVRSEAKKLGIPLWAVADAVGVSEPTMTRLLRRELSEDEKEKIRAIIVTLAADREGGTQ